MSSTGNWQPADTFQPRPREKIVVYVPKRHRDSRLVDRLKDHARAVNRSPSAVVMLACERYLDAC